MPEEFCYPNLDIAFKATRLLVLRPDLHPQDGRLQCKLATGGLGETYEALSYEWGDTDDLDLKIWVNDALVPIRKNLFSALWILRGPVDRRLWVDALCINQADRRERDHQVGMMGAIYENAEQVLVWLGNSDESSKEESKSLGSKLRQLVGNSDGGVPTIPAFQLVRLLAEKGHNWLDWIRSGVWENMSYLSDEYVLHWQQLAELCSLPYWRRMWIVQEFGLAAKSQILYGTAICDGRHFIGFCERIKMLPKGMALQARMHNLAGIPKVAHSLIRIYDSKPVSISGTARAKFSGRRYAPSKILVELLNLCADQFCAERRDKIFALLGLASDIDEGEFPISYSEPIPHLYENVVSQIVRRHGSHQLVQYSQTLQRGLLGPLSLNDGPVDMVDHPPSHAQTFSFTQSAKQYRVVGFLAGSVWKIPFRLPWAKITLDDIRNPTKLFLAPLPISDMDLNQLAVALEGLWEVDHNSIQAFGEYEKCEDFVLFAFNAKSGVKIGLGRDCIQDSDVLCRFEDSDIAAVCRRTGGTYSILGRALIGLSRSRKQPERATISVERWPPPDGEVYDPRSLNEYWAQKCDIDVDIATIQALSRPLKWRNQ